MNRVIFKIYLRLCLDRFLFVCVPLWWSAASVRAYIPLVVRTPSRIHWRVSLQNRSASGVERQNPWTGMDENRLRKRVNRRQTGYVDVGHSGGGLRIVLVQTTRSAKRRKRKNGNDCRRRCFVVANRCRVSPVGKKTVTVTSPPVTVTA